MARFCVEFQVFNLSRNDVLSLVCKYDMMCGIQSTLSWPATDSSLRICISQFLFCFMVSCATKKWDQILSFVFLFCLNLWNNISCCLLCYQVFFLDILIWTRCALQAGITSAFSCTCYSFDVSFDRLIFYFVNLR